MKTEFWSKNGSIPPISEVIQTVDVNCMNCGRSMRFVAPEKLVDHEELAKYWQSVAKHYAEELAHAKSVINKLTHTP